jgi:hypothetical protein
MNRFVVTIISMLVVAGAVPLAKQGYDKLKEEEKCDKVKWDYDGDGLGREEEESRGLDPCNNDTDGDTLTDWEEIYETKTDPADNDTDNDSLPDNTDPSPLNDTNDADSDGVYDQYDIDWGEDVWVNMTFFRNYSTPNREETIFSLWVNYGIWYDNGSWDRSLYNDTTTFQYNWSDDPDEQSINIVWIVHDGPSEYSHWFNIDGYASWYYEDENCTFDWAVQVSRI